MKMHNKFAGGSLLMATSKIAIAVTLPCSVLSYSVAALGQDAAPTVEEAQQNLQTIIVTATRRESNVQDVPLAITAIDGDSLREAGISNPEDLSGLAPTMHVDQGISSSQTHVSLRGIAATGFNVSVTAPIATNIDDVYQPFQWGNATQIFDLNRIEVLRGPQGTLFGKNATGGALGFFSQQPTANTEGYAQAAIGGGDFTHYSLEGALNVAATDELAFRFSGRYSGRDPYIDNIAPNAPASQQQLGEDDTYGFRAQMRWRPSDATDVNLKFHYAEGDSDGPIYWTNQIYPGGFAFFFPGVTLPTNIREASQETETFEAFDTRGLVLNIRQDIGSLTLTSISHWQKGSFGYANNDDGTDYTLSTSFQGADSEQYGQELRLATDPDEPTSAIFGAFYQHDSMSADQGFEFFGDYGGSLQQTQTDAWALFASVTQELSPELSLTAGGRFTQEDRDHTAASINYATNSTGSVITRFNDALTQLVPNPATSLCYGILCYETQTESGSWDRFTWDLTANYTPNSDVLIYAKVASGFRSGALPYQSAYIGTSEPKIGSVDPEKVSSYELGFKTEWADNTLRLNGAVHYNDYTNLQLQVTAPFGFGTVLQNAGSARIWGAELEVELAPVDMFTLYGSVGVLDAKYSEFIDVVTNTDYSGNPLPYAPDVTANLGFNYRIPLGSAELGISSDWRYQSEIFFDSYQQAESAQQGYITGSAQVSLSLPDTGATVTAYVNNITNEEVKGFQYFAFAGTLAPAIYQPRRTYGVRLAMEF